MSAPVRVPINAEALRWAREVARLDVATLAKAAGISLEKYAKFEDGVTQPTYNQAAAMAKKLDRTIPFLLVPPPASPDVPETIDFRGRGYDEGDMPDSLARELKRAQEHREAFLALTHSVKDIFSTPIDWNSAPEAAETLRSQMGLAYNFVPPENQRSQVFNFWRGLVEQAGYLVFQTTGIKSSVFRGLSIDHKILPIIIVNGSDAPLARVFTLFHEIAHIANRTSGLCSLRENIHEEAVCNRFATYFLMPEKAVSEVLEGTSEGQRQIALLAGKFRVSLVAAAVRLKNLNKISQIELENVQSDSDEAWQRQQRAQREKEGFVPSWRLRYRDLGETYVGAVARAVDERQIDWLEATYMLDARVPTVEKMFEEYYRTGGRQ